MARFSSIDQTGDIRLYNAIVIGAGLSGLTAAAFLAKEGARVLVCEQAAQVGGLFNSFRGEGYQFDGGIKAVINSAVMMPMLAQLGLLERIEFQRSPIALVTSAHVQPILGFSDVEAYFQLLGTLFSDEQVGLQRVLRDTKTIFELLDGISETDRISRSDYFEHVPQEISIPFLHQPDMAPPGKIGLNISAMTSWQYNGGWERSPAEYARLKKDYARQLIGSLKRFIPHLSEHIELCITATPRTIKSLTSNTEGAILGWSYHRRSTLPRGQFYQMRSSVLTPISHLLTAGH